MNGAEERRDSLKEKVSAAFADVPRPDKNNIALCPCPECTALTRTLAGVEWRAVTPEVLEATHEQLPLFSPRAFRYFLPAYLLHSLDHFGYDGVCEFTVYALTPGKETESSAAYNRERFARFAPEQMDVVHDFLDLARQDESFAGYHTAIERGKKRLMRYVGR